MKTRYYYLTYLALVALLVVIVWALAGCSTLKRNQKRLFLVERDNPELLTKYCAKEFPIIEKDNFFTETKPGSGYIDGGSVDCIAELTKKGYTVTFGDQLHNGYMSNADTGKENAILRYPNYPGNYISTPCPPIKRPDTIIQYRDRIRENTAALDTMAKAKEREREGRIKAESKAGTWFKISLGLGIGIVVLIALIFLLFRKKVSII